MILWKTNIYIKGNWEFASKVSVFHCNMSDIVNQPDTDSPAGHRTLSDPDMFGARCPAEFLRPDMSGVR